MSIINFDHEFVKFVFRGNKDDIWSLFTQSENDCRYEPCCNDEQNWEIELFTENVESLINAYPLLKAAGFVLNWNTRTVYVAYSESGSTKIDKIHEVGHFDGRSDPEFRWYFDCPIVTERYSCKEYYSNAGDYDRFPYNFPYLTLWNKGRYSTHLLSDDELSFSISPDGVLLECNSKEAVIKVPDGVKSIAGYAFVECSCIGKNTTLIEVILPESLQEISEKAFCSCYNLTTIHLPQGLETIGEGAFMSTKIEKLSIPVGLKNLSGDSLFLSTISQFQVPEDHPVFCVKDNCLYNKATHKLIRYFGDKTSVLIPEGIEEIDNHAFSNCDITEVIMPESLRRIGNNAFCSCKNMKNIHIPKNVTEIGYGAFEYCSALESIVLPDALTQIHFSTF
ncbi:MAG: leucine-rich repeat domain-containing protein, partial [Akkermansia sp.]|nr:leucine-rich repeat domain-containing protein [Akkermansia sp.]